MNSWQRITTGEEQHVKVRWEHNQVQKNECQSQLTLFFPLKKLLYSYQMGTTFINISTYYFTKVYFLEYLEYLRSTATFLKNSQKSTSPT